MLFFFQVFDYDSLIIIHCILDLTMLKTGSSHLKEEEEDDQADSIHNLPLPTPQRRARGGVKAKRCTHSPVVSMGPVSV